MAIDAQVPQWLQPMSQAQRRQMELMEEQVRQKGVSMLRKQIGVARMKDEAAKLAATGMDEIQARKTALLSNADLIFADEPEALARLVQSEESNAIRERANQILQQKADELNTYREHIVDLQREKMEGAEDVMPTVQEFEGQKFLVNPKSGVPTRLTPESTEPQVKEIDGQKFLITKSGAAHPLQGRLSQAAAIKLRSLYSELAEVRKELALQGGDSATSDSAMQLKLRRAKVERQIRELSGEPEPRKAIKSDANGSDDDAEPAPKRLRYNPTTRKLE